MEILSPTPGWRGAVYAAPNGPTPEALDDFKRLAPIEQESSRERIRLDTGGKRYRYYLVWITRLPPEEASVEIAEIRLFRLSRS